MKRETKERKKGRYIPVNNFEGIRLDTYSGKYQAIKTVKRKNYSKTFRTITEAVNWRNEFHPSVNYTTFKNEICHDDIIPNVIVKKVSDKQNGTDLGYTFSDIWNLYRKHYFPLIEVSTQNQKRLIAKRFFSKLMDYKMTEMTSSFLDEYIVMMKEIYQSKKNSRRYNFTSELKALSAIFNWYREEGYDSSFVNPMLKRHRAFGIIRQLPHKKKKMNRGELIKFFNSFEKQFWHDFAEFQFYIAGRVQDVAGIQVDDIDLGEMEMDITNVAVWSRMTLKFLYLKPIPKNGESKSYPVTGKLHEIIKRRLDNRADDNQRYYCPIRKRKLNFLFHDNGVPFSYRKIQYEYNKALKIAGLDHKFSSTHFLRHSMANITRKLKGLDHAQSVGGWKSRDMVENVYTEVPTEIALEAVNAVENFMNESNLSDVRKGNIPNFSDVRKFTLVKND